MQSKTRFIGVRLTDKLFLSYIRKFPSHPLKLRIINVINDVFFRNSVWVKTDTGAVFQLSTRDQFGWGIMVQDCYEPFTLKISQEILKSGGTLVDVGANVGLISIYLSRIPNVSVYAIEPSVINFQKLMEHISANKCKNVTPLNVALSFKDSFGYLHNEFVKNSGTVRVVEQNHAGSYLIRLCTLSDLLAHLQITAIDLLKIDVEGYEINVLKGLFKTGNTIFPKNMILEYGTQIERTGYNIVELFMYFNQLGYAPFDVQGRPYVYPAHMPEGNLLFKYML
jgi:FkbM family methyltransferase